MHSSRGEDICFSPGFLAGAGPCKQSELHGRPARRSAANLIQHVLSVLAYEAYIYRETDIYSALVHLVYIQVLTVLGRDFNILLCLSGKKAVQNLIVDLWHTGIIQNVPLIKEAHFISYSILYR